MPHLLPTPQRASPSILRPKLLHGPPVTLPQPPTSPITPASLDTTLAFQVVETFSQLIRRNRVFLADLDAQTIHAGKPTIQLAGQLQLFVTHLVSEHLGDTGAQRPAARTHN